MLEESEYNNSMSMNPRLSILVPTHNREDLLRQTLQSVLNQISGLEQIELIISNDASKDGTQNFLDHFSKEHSDLKVKVFHHEKNLGGPGNWKFLLEQAHGEFVYLLSDDDTIKSNFLKSYFEVLEKYPHVDIIYSGIEYCDENMKPLSESMISSVPGLVSGVERLKNLLIANHMVMSSIYRRETFLKAGGWQAKYGTCLDGAAFALMCAHSKETFFIERALFSFRLGSQTWSSFRIDKQKGIYENFRLINDDILDWAKSKDPQNVSFYKKCYAAHAQGILNILDLKMVHGQLQKSDLRQLLDDLVAVYPETRTLLSYAKLRLVSVFGMGWLQFFRRVLGKKALYGTSVFEKGFDSQGEKQWV